MLHFMLGRNIKGIISRKWEEIHGAHRTHQRLRNKVQVEVEGLQDRKKIQETKLQQFPENLGEISWRSFHWSKWRWIAAVRCSGMPVLCDSGKCMSEHTRQEAANTAGLLEGGKCNPWNLTQGLNTRHQLKDSSNHSAAKSNTGNSEDAGVSSDLHLCRRDYKKERLWGSSERVPEF